MQRPNIPGCWITAFVLLFFLAVMPGAGRVWAQGVDEQAREVDFGNPTYEPVDPPGALPQLNAIFKQIARRVRPTVVFLEVRIPSKQALPEDGRHQLDEEFLRKYFEPRIEDSAGSGVFISRSGYIVTNHHVVKDAVDIQAVLHDNRRLDAEVVGSDPTTDIAVLQVNGDGEFPAIALGNSSQVEVGEWVLAIGNPFRLASTVTSGIVSGLGRQVSIIEGEMGIEDFIQTDAAINPGNSGGALVNLRGELVGINTAIATRNGRSEGYGFAVPVNLVKRVAEDLIAYGEVRRGYLGVEIQSVTPQVAKERGLDRVAGIVVRRVVEGGAAEKAGLQIGDILVSVDGQEVNATNELQSLLAQNFRPGDVVRVGVRRDNQIRHFSVTLLGREGEAFKNWLTRGESREQPSASGDESHMSLTVLDTWGLGLRDLDDEQTAAFGLRDGAYVAYVEGGSPASDAGVPRDAVITGIEDRPVRSANAVRELLQSTSREDGTVLVRVRRKDQTTGFYEIDVPQTSSD